MFMGHPSAPENRKVYMCHSFLLSPLLSKITLHTPQSVPGNIHQVCLPEPGTEDLSGIKTVIAGTHHRVDPLLDGNIPVAGQGPPQLSFFHPGLTFRRSKSVGDMHSIDHGGIKSRHILGSAPPARPEVPEIYDKAEVVHPDLLDQGPALNKGVDRGPCRAFVLETDPVLCPDPANFTDIPCGEVYVLPLGLVEKLHETVKLNSIAVDFPGCPGEEFGLFKNPAFLLRILGFHITNDVDTAHFHLPGIQE